MVGQIDRGADRTSQRDRQVANDGPNRSWPRRLRVPEQYEVVRNVKRVDYRQRQHPRSQSPDAEGVGEEDDAEQRTEYEIVRDAVEPMTEYHDAEVRRVAGELECFGEIRKCEQQEQHRHHGEEPSTASGFICHARDANRVRNQIQAAKNETAGAY